MPGMSNDPRYLFISTILVMIRVGDEPGEGEVHRMFEMLGDLTKSSTMNGQTSSEVSALLLETAIAFSNAQFFHDRDVCAVWDIEMAESMDRIIAFLMG